MHDATGYGPYSPLRFGADHPGGGRVTRGRSRDLSSHWDAVTGDQTGLGAEPRAGSVGALSRGWNSEIDAAIKQYERENGILLTSAEKRSLRSQFITGVRDTGSLTDKNRRRQALGNHLASIQPRAGINISGDNLVRSVDGIWGDSSIYDDLGYYTKIEKTVRYVAGQRVVEEKDSDTTARIRYASTQSVIRKLDEEIGYMRSSGNFTQRQINKALAFRSQFVQRVLGGRGGFLGSIGGRIGQGMYLRSWIKDELKGKFLGSLMMGTLFDYKNDLWLSGALDHFATKYESRIVPGDREFGLSWLEGKNNILGKVANAYYYWHPVNIAKGIFWDGRFWKKLSDMGRMPPHIAERLAKIMPGQFLFHVKKKLEDFANNKLGRGIANALKRPFAKFAQRYLSDFSQMTVGQLLKMPFKQLLTSVIQKVLVQALGSIIPGIGNIAAFVADWAIKMGWKLGEFFLKPLIEFIALIVLGLFSIGLILGSAGLSFFGKQTLAQPYLSEPVDFTSGHLVYGPVDFDFPDYSDGKINCNQTLPDQNIPGIISKEVFGDLADRWTGGVNYADECYNDVICRALSKGVDPAFALLIWLHESGASNYDSSSLPVQDFGINDGVTPAEDFNSQVNTFMALSHNYSCPGLDYWTSWATRYLTGTCDATRDVNGITGPEYLNGKGDNPGIKEIYQWIKPGASLPSKIKDPSRATGQLCVGTGGSVYPNYTGGSMSYGGSVLSGTAFDILNQVAAEFGVNARLEFLYPGSGLYGRLTEAGAWCWSGAGVISCLPDEILSASSAMLTGLFRHEIAHQVQHSNGSISNWPYLRHREWGAEHLSGNGGHYMFSTSSGYCMRGLQVSQSLLDSGKCTKSELDEIAKGKALSGTACASQVRSFITGATIGNKCN